MLRHYVRAFLLVLAVVSVRSAGAEVATRRAAAEFASFWQTRVAMLDQTPGALGFSGSQQMWFRGTDGGVRTVRCVGMARRPQLYVLHLPAGPASLRGSLVPGACTLTYEVGEDPGDLRMDESPLYRATTDCLRLLDGVLGSNTLQVRDIGIVAEGAAAPVGLAVAALMGGRIAFVALHQPEDPMGLDAATMASLSVRSLTELATSPSVVLSGRVLAADVAVPCLVMATPDEVGCQALATEEIAGALNGPTRLAALTAPAEGPLQQTPEALNLLRTWVTQGCPAGPQDPISAPRTLGP